MDVMVKLNIPNFVYRFYSDASNHVFGCTAEDLMADALSAYAGLLSEAVSKERERNFAEYAEKKA